MTSCAHCGTAMPTPTGRAARRRYCSTNCKHAAYRRRHGRREIVADIVTDPNIVATSSRETAIASSRPHRCPNCGHQLAVIAVVVPVAAAEVRTPEVVPMSPG